LTIAAPGFKSPPGVRVIPMRLAEFRSESVCEKNDAASRIVLLLARSSIKGFVIS